MKKHKRTPKKNDRRAKAKARALQRRKARRGKQVLLDLSLRSGD